MQEEIKEQQYHYIIGVGTTSMLSKRPGSFYRDITLEYSEEEYEKFMYAVTASKNTLWKTTLNEACNIFEVDNFAGVMHSIQVRMAVHPLMLIHFISPQKMSHNELDVFIEYSDLKTLEKYKIKSGGSNEKLF